MGQILAYLFIAYLIYIIAFPNTNSTSYRLGSGVGRKTKKFGKWLMDDWNIVTKFLEPLGVKARGFFIGNIT